MKIHLKSLVYGVIVLAMVISLAAGCAPAPAPTQPPAPTKAPAAPEPTKAPAAPEPTKAPTAVPTKAPTAAPAKITISLETSVYAEAPHKAALDALKKAYEAKNPNTVIEIYGAPYVEFWNKLQTEMVAGTEACIVQLQEDATRYATYAALREGESGAFVNLDKYIKGTKYETDLTNQGLMKYKDHYIGISNYAWGVHGIYYRKSLLKEANVDPATIKTWDNLVQAAIKLTKPATATKPAQYGFGVLIGAAPLALSEWEAVVARPVGNGFFFGKEAAPYTSANVVINSKPIVWAAKQWQDLNFKYHVTSVGHKTKGDVRTQFWNGQVAMTIEGPWFTGMSRSNAPAVLDNDTGLIPLPKIVYEGKEYIYQASPNAITHLISSKCKNPDEAWKFLEWMASPEGQALVALSGMIPSSSSFTTSDAYKKSEPINAQFVEFLKIYQPAMPRPSIPQMGEITNIALEAVQEMFVAGKDVQTSLDTAADRIKKVMDKK